MTHKLKRFKSRTASSIFDQHHCEPVVFFKFCKLEFSTKHKTTVNAFETDSLHQSSFLAQILSLRLKNCVIKKEIFV